MKKIFFISPILFLLFSLSAFAQTKHQNHSHYNNVNFSVHWNTNDFNLFFGQHSYRELYFDYKPRKGTWRLKRDVRKTDVRFGFGFDRKTRVLARFENPNGGRDFIIRINRAGYWKYSGPNKWYHLFRKKLLKNL